MADLQDIRWKQRFSNFSKAFTLYEKIVLQIRNNKKAGRISSDIEKMALIQAFEMIFELSWKTLKDYLESEGFVDLASPRRVIKQAFESAYLKNGELWILALVDRNIGGYDYDIWLLLLITAR